MHLWFEIWHFQNGIVPEWQNWKWRTNSTRSIIKWNSLLFWVFIPIHFSRLSTPSPLFDTKERFVLFSFFLFIWPKVKHWLKIQGMGVLDVFSKILDKGSLIIKIPITPKTGQPLLEWFPIVCGGVVQIYTPFPLLCFYFWPTKSNLNFQKCGLELWLLRSLCSFKNVIKNQRLFRSLTIL